PYTTLFKSRRRVWLQECWVIPLLVLPGSPTRSAHTGTRLNLDTSFSPVHSPASSSRRRATRYMQISDRSAASQSNLCETHHAGNATQPIQARARSGQTPDWPVVESVQ